MRPTSHAHLIASLVVLPLAGSSCGRQAVAPRAVAGTAGPVAGETPAVNPESAAQRDPWKGRDDLLQPPQARPVPALDLTGVSRRTLSNRLPVMLVPDSDLPLITVQLGLLVGSIDDPAERVGLADFTADMLRQGVRGMSADLISHTVDQAGISLSVDSGYETSSIRCSGRREVLALCLKLVAGLARRPTFPSHEIAEVRDRLLGEVRSARDDPSKLARLHFYNLLYGDGHPAGRPMTEASVQQIARVDLLRFHRKHYLPARAVLSLSGDIEPRQAFAQARRAFGGWRGAKGVSRRGEAFQRPAKGMKLLLVDKPDLSQSFFALGHAGIPIEHPRRDAARVMNYVLGGGGFSSRLMKIVRSEGGKTYGIYSHFAAHRDDGSFVIASFTRNEQIVAMLRLVQGELRRIRETPPSAREIQAAKGKIAGGYTIRFQTKRQLAGALATAQLQGLADSYVSELALRVQQIDGPAAEAAATALIHPDRLVGAVVGRASVVGPLLEKAGILFTKISYLDPISAKERSLGPPNAP